MQTVTIGQLSIFADSIYDNGPIPSGFTVLDVAINEPDGFYAEAWINNTTKEIVIAYRGTVPSNFSTLEQDAYVASGRIAPGAIDAANFADAVATKTLNEFPGYTLSVTGHSLGGYEAQVALATLDRNQENTVLSPYAAVFNSPGIPASYLAGIPTTSYNALAIYSQGDVVHLTGGVYLGQLPPVSVPAGPTILSEFSSAAASFGVGLLGGQTPRPQALALFEGLLLVPTSESLRQDSPLDLPTGLVHMSGTGPQLDPSAHFAPGPQRDCSQKNRVESMVGVTGFEPATPTSRT